MEATPIYYDNSMYLLTSKYNKISKQSLIRGTENIIIEGKAVIQSMSILRGDLAQIKMGQYVILREDVVIRPTYTKTKQKGLKYVQLSIGDNVYIDKASIVCALKIGNNVHIGKNCIIGHRSILRDNCRILDGSILPPDTIVPPFTVYGGRPATYIGELPETIGVIHKDLTTNFYKNFQGVDPRRQGGGNQSQQQQPVSSSSQPQNTARALAEQERQN